MTSNKKDIIVIGASAGGFEAMSNLLQGLPQGFEASIFIVVHMNASSTGNGLVSYLRKATKATCKLAENNEPIEKGTIYIAPPDFHMILEPEKIKVIKGPRENKFRPAIDPLFRSAAVNFSSRTIGIILSGLLEDGTAGMHAIKKCGGTTIIQDPDEAAFPDMPLIVSRTMKVNYILPVSDIGKILLSLIKEPANENAAIPDELILENKIAHRHLMGTELAEKVGELSTYVCPECGGNLWQKNEEGFTHFRCHTGHTFDPHNLLYRKSEGLEESIWISLRLLEEKKNLFLLLAEKSKHEDNGFAARQFHEKANESAIHIERMREFLFSVTNTVHVNTGN